VTSLGSRGEQPVKLGLLLPKGAAPLVNLGTILLQLVDIDHFCSVRFRPTLLFSVTFL
jgi:hypothetical protein